MPLGLLGMYYAVQANLETNDILGHELTLPGPVQDLTEFRKGFSISHPVPFIVKGTLKVRVP